MNQILSNTSNKKTNKSLIFKKSILFRAIFIISLSIFSFGLFFLVFDILKEFNNEQIVKKLSSTYSISTLYSNNIEINENKTNEINTPFVIGIIKIDKINLNYPILSISSNDLLNISICRFAGPMPNEIGNLCLAGHNYVDYKFFSRLNELNINDKITIFDLNGTSKEYNIYKKYEINPNDTSCTLQDTNNLKIVTLVTCNNINGKRLILKAKEIP